MLGIFFFSHILLKRSVRSRMRKKDLTKIADVNPRAEVEVVFPKVGKIESVIPPLKFYCKRRKTTRHD